jgi:hypothetical protein
MEHVLRLVLAAMRRLEGWGPLQECGDPRLEVQVVLANSSIIREPEIENPDVFFILKGAGASFGVITESKVRTEPEPGEAVQYSYSFDARTTTEKVKAFKN